MEEGTDIKKIPSFWQRFNAKWSARWALRMLLALFAVALLAPFIANDKPLYYSYCGEHFFPAFSLHTTYQIKSGECDNMEIGLDAADWKRLKADHIIWPLIPYSPNTSERKNRFLNADFTSPLGEQRFLNDEGEVGIMPKRFYHFLGTNRRGEDVLSGLIHGATISLSIGVFSILLASLIGITLGVLSGYFGDYHIVAKRGALFLLVPGVILGYYYGFSMRSFDLSDSLGNSNLEFLFEFLISSCIFLSFCLIAFQGNRLFSKLTFMQKEVSVPMDSGILKLIELLHVFPRLVWVLALAALVGERSATTIVIIIGLTSWTGIARFIRAECLKLREAEYVKAAQALGVPTLRILIRHVIPNAIPPAIVVMAFGVSGAILIESGLSFLGIGVPQDQVTWGNLLQSAREAYSSWWLVVFPGLAIFATVMIFNLIGEGVREALSPTDR